MYNHIHIRDTKALHNEQTDEDACPGYERCVQGFEIINGVTPFSDEESGSDKSKKRSERRFKYIVWSASSCEHGKPYQAAHDIHYL